jgi:capsular exopolysaccharide synthesis family protein
MEDSMIIETTTAETKSAAAPRESGFSADVQEYALTILRGVGWPMGGNAAPRVLGLTSCERGEGVSILATQLAVAAASCGTHRVLLVDANLHCPSAHRILDRELTPGLADILFGRSKLSEGIQAAPVANLSLLTAGTVHDEALSRVYDCPHLPELIGNLRQEFSLVVFDLPATANTSAAFRLAGMLDGVLLVVEAERVRWEAAQRVGELLHRSNAHLLGAILNKRRRHLPGWLDRRL